MHSHQVSRFSIPPAPQGPPVELVRCSPGGSFTALQRSERVIEVREAASGNMFVETPAEAKAG